MDKNELIYKEMRAAAERVFNDGINAPAGVYSLAELVKVGTTCKTAPAGVYFREDYNADELININVDGFECSYPARAAFALAYKFERLAKVGAKARAVFQRVEDHGEVSRRVALAERLAATFAVACSAVCLKTINNAANTFYIAQNESIIFAGAKCVALHSPCYKNGIMTATATAADSVKTRLKYNYNAFAAFAAPVAPVEDVAEDSDNAEHVAPVEDVTEDSDNAEHVAPVEDAAEDSDNAEHVAPVEDAAEDSDNAEHIAPVEDAAEGNDNAEHVAPRRVWLGWLKVAAVLLLALIFRTVSTNESNAAAPSIDSRAAPLNWQVIDDKGVICAAPTKRECQRKENVMRKAGRHSPSLDKSTCKVFPQ